MDPLELGASQGGGSAFYAQGGAGGGEQQPRLRPRAVLTEQQLQQWQAQVFGNSGMPHASLPLSDGGLARRPPHAWAIQTSVSEELSQDAAEVLRTFADEELWRGCLHGSLQEALDDGASMADCLPGKRIVCLFESNTGEVCVLCVVCCMLCVVLYVVCCVLCAVCVVCSCTCATQKLVCGYDLIVWVTW